MEAVDGKGGPEPIFHWPDGHSQRWADVPDDVLTPKQRASRESHLRYWWPNEKPRTRSDPVPSCSRSCTRAWARSSWQIPRIVRSFVNGLWVLLVYPGPVTHRARLELVVLNPEVDSSSEARIQSGA